MVEQTKVKVGKVLLVDDDKTLLDVLRYNLEKENYDVVTASDGAEALELARAENPDLIILDVMLPGLDGLEVCRILRKETTVPIVMLTAKGEEVDRVVGLELGADDYVTKPFSVRELLARVRATLRRSQLKQHPSSTPSANDEGDESLVIEAGEFRVDVLRHAISRKGEHLQLSPKEFELLAFLIRNQGKVFVRETLVEKIWGYDYEGTARTIDVHIRSLRTKIERDPARPEHLITIHGFGYKFEA